MKVRLTRSQMLAQWKQRNYLEPLRSDCQVERSDGIDLDSYCEWEMRRWYLHLLATADLRYLSPTDLTLTTTVKRLDGNRGSITLPAGTVRPVRVRLSGWQRDATIVTDRDSRIARRQFNPFACGGVEEPVALWSGDGHLEIFSLPTTTGSPLPEAVTAIVDHGAEIYEFDEQAWELLENPKSNSL